VTFQIQFIKQFSKVQQNHKPRHAEAMVNFRLLILVPKSQNPCIVIVGTEPEQRVIQRI